MFLEEKARRLYRDFGQSKPMGKSSLSLRKPHYFLLRRFRGDNDLLIILNTKRCRYQCGFCQLPTNSMSGNVPSSSVLKQVEYVLHQMQHCLSTLDRLTISNNGSVLDPETLLLKVLLQIARCVHELRSIRTLVLETRLAFVSEDVIRLVKEAAPRVAINILTGFETRDLYIREKILGKNETLDSFAAGLDRVAEASSELTCFILYKPSPYMSDTQAFVEAEESIDYLSEQCRRRSIPLVVRLNPMYPARGSSWAKLAEETPNYAPPRLTDVMKLAEKKTRQGIPVYIGLSTEGLAEPEGMYIAREDYSPHLIGPIKLCNDSRILRFNWRQIECGQGMPHGTNQP